MVKSFAIKDTIMAPNFSLYITIKRVLASSRCVSNTEIVQFLQRAKREMICSTRLEKKQTLHHTRIGHGQSLYWTAKSSFLFLASDHTEADPNYTLGVNFWTKIFYNLKKPG